MEEIKKPSQARSLSAEFEAILRQLDRQSVQVLHDMMAEMVGGARA